MNNALTREEYLEEAVELIRPIFESNRFKIPPISVSCGFGSRNPKKTLGECWTSTATEDGRRQIFISPAIHNSALDVLGTLTHELLHAVLPDDAKHGPLFKQGMKTIGLVGKAKYAKPDESLNKTLKGMADKLGEWPNSKIIFREKEKKTRKKSVFSVICTNKMCFIKEKLEDGLKFEVKVKRNILDVGFPVCPCGDMMELSLEDQESFEYEK